jgi:hypothetical protein
MWEKNATSGFGAVSSAATLSIDMGYLKVVSPSLKFVNQGGEEGGAYMIFIAFVGSSRGTNTFSIVTVPQEDSLFPWIENRYISSGRSRRI